MKHLLVGQEVCLEVKVPPVVDIARSLEAYVGWPELMMEHCLIVGAYCMCPRNLPPFKKYVPG